MSSINDPIILGIDVGTATTGWAILKSDQNKPITLGFGIISTSSTSPMPFRLSEIYANLAEIIDRYQPTHAAVESLFFFKNQKTVMTVSQARGVLLLGLEQKGVIISEYTPLQVKTAVTGYGRAEKKQVQEMTKVILNLESVPKPDDAADALAIGLCHLQSINNLNNRIY
jgi:crossover junction endodeoxyribonuclease RuvC